jgi:hypothetical protein
MTYPEKLYSIVGETGNTLNTVFVGTGSISQLGTTIVSGSSYQTVASYTYAPQLEYSKIIVEYNSQYYISGSGNDSWYANVTVDGVEVSQTYLNLVSGSGNFGAARTGNLFPIVGAYDNSTTLHKTILVRVKRGTSDDNLEVYGNVGTSLKITEIGVQ